jgi:hypothetical protein
MWYRQHLVELYGPPAPSELRQAFKVVIPYLVAYRWAATGVGPFHHGDAQNHVILRVQPQVYGVSAPTMEAHGEGQ